MPLNEAPQLFVAEHRRDVNHLPLTPAPGFCWDCWELWERPPRPAMDLGGTSDLWASCSPVVAQPTGPDAISMM